VRYNGCEFGLGSDIYYSFSSGGLYYDTICVYEGTTPYIFYYDSLNQETPSTLSTYTNTTTNCCYDNTPTPTPTPLPTSTPTPTPTPLPKARFYFFYDKKSVFAARQFIMAYRIANFPDCPPASYTRVGVQSTGVCSAPDGEITVTPGQRIRFFFESSTGRKMWWNYSLSTTCPQQQQTYCKCPTVGTQPPQIQINSDTNIYITFFSPLFYFTYCT
jgi:hypothetical protein